jgi:transposase InsO family protein
MLRSGDIRIIKTPILSPRANALAERFVGPLRRERLDRMLTIKRAQLEKVLAELVTLSHERRLHRSLGQSAPLGAGSTPLRISDPDPGQLRRNDEFGVLIHGYRLAA